MDFPQLAAALAAQGGVKVAAQPDRKPLFTVGSKEDGVAPPSDTSRGNRDEEDDGDDVSGSASDSGSDS